jgi:hypothetical protein
VLDGVRDEASGDVAGEARIRRRQDRDLHERRANTSGSARMSVANA